MARLYHPDLAADDDGNLRVYECPDDDGLLSVLAESGWLPAPEAEQRPGYAPEPVKASAGDKPRTRSKTTKSD